MQLSAPLQEGSLPVSRVRSDLGLGHYAAHIQELVLYLRDEGHVLSSMDQHIIEGWWEAGYPLDLVLRVVHERGLRLKARKNPPRGLPLRSLRRYVDKEGQRAAARAVGEHRDDAAVEAAEAGRLSVVLSGIEADLADALALTGQQEPVAIVLEQLVQELSGLAAARLAEPALFSTLLSFGRRYYEALWQACPEEQRRRLRQEVLDELGEAVGSMSLDALEETLEELCRRRLRAGDPLFDPDRYWRV